MYCFLTLTKLSNYIFDVFLFLQIELEKRLKTFPLRSFFMFERVSIVKVWKDANEAIKMIHEVPEKLKDYDREMQKKPKFDKCKKKEGKHRIK